MLVTIITRDKLCRTIFVTQRIHAQRRSFGSVLCKACLLIFSISSLELRLLFIARCCAHLQNCLWHSLSTQIHDELISLAQYGDINANNMYNEESR